MDKRPEPRARDRDKKGCRERRGTHRAQASSLQRALGTGASVPPHAPPEYTETARWAVRRGQHWTPAPQ